MTRFSKFSKIEHALKKKGVCKRIALACAHDGPALSAVVHAVRQGLVEAVLIGDEAGILALLAEMKEDPASYQILHETEERAAAAEAVALVRSGEADIVMKGLMQTASYMRAILDKQNGILPAGRVLSETTLAEYPAGNRFLLITDCGINISPDLETKVKILNNAVDLAHLLGIECPKAACLSALELVNPKIPSSVEAAALAEMEWQGCEVQGPLALDNAIDKLAAEHKGISGPVAGVADILLVPDLVAGNILHKSLNFFAGCRMAGVVCGTEHPVILTSRTDDPATKYHSILIAILQSTQ